MTKAKTFTIEATVEERIWGPDDTYSVVEVQVDGHLDVKIGDKVKVTIKKIATNGDKGKKED